MVGRVIQTTLKISPMIGQTGLCNVLSALFKRRVTRAVLYRICNQLCWSWRVPTVVQLNKYTAENLTQYMHHVDALQDIEWDNLVYLDEAHVVSRSLRKKKVLGVVNQRTWIKDSDLHGNSLSVTLLVRLDQQPIFVELREDSNTQYDFLTVVALAIRSGFLRSGDFLLVDNACVHGGTATLLLLLDMLAIVNVQLIYLPKYSPELNPCELVFNLMKSYLRNHRNRRNPVWIEVLERISSNQRYSHHSVLLSMYQC